MRNKRKAPVLTVSLILILVAVAAGGFTLYDRFWGDAGNDQAQAAGGVASSGSARDRSYEGCLAAGSAPGLSSGSTERYCACLADLAVARFGDDEAERVSPVLYGMGSVGATVGGNVQAFDLRLECLSEALAQP